MSVSLTDLPPELLLHILSYLPPQFCLSSLSLVSSSFHSLLKDDNWWRNRKKEMGLLINEKEEKCSEYCVRRLVCRSAMETKRWTALPRHKPLPIHTAHFGTVNAVRLFTTPSGNRRCISAGRDRRMAMWDIEQVKQAVNASGEGTSGTVGERKELVDSVDVAHSGWIWQVTRPNCDNRLLSSGWDYFLKTWDISPTGIKEVGQCNLGSAVVGLDWIDGSTTEAICSTFFRRVCIVDGRDGMKVVQEYSRHKNAVIGVASKGHTVYSWGEDALIMMSDMRNLKTSIATVKVSRGYANIVSLSSTSLVAGTSKGQCLYLDPNTLTSRSNFVVRDVAGMKGGTAYEGVDPVRGVVNTGSSLLTLSKFGKLNAFTYGESPRHIMTWEDLGGEPSRMDYYQGDVVVAVGDGRLLLWEKPSKQDLQLVDNL